MLLGCTASLLKLCADRKSLAFSGPLSWWRLLSRLLVMLLHMMQVFSRGEIFRTIFCLFGLEQDGSGQWVVLELSSGWCSSSSLRCLISSQARDLLQVEWHVFKWYWIPAFSLSERPKKFLSSKYIEIDITLSLPFSALHNFVLPLLSLTFW